MIGRATTTCGFVCSPSQLHLTASPTRSLGLIEWSRPTHTLYRRVTFQMHQMRSEMPAKRTSCRRLKYLIDDVDERRSRLQDALTCCKQDMEDMEAPPFAYYRLSKSVNQGHPRRSTRIGTLNMTRANDMSKHVPEYQCR